MKFSIYINSNQNITKTPWEPLSQKKKKILHCRIELLSSLDDQHGEQTLKDKQQSVSRMLSNKEDVV